MNDTKRIDGFYFFLNSFFALILLILLFPLIILIGIIIRITSRGSIIFMQERLGHDKKAFNFYKFRTMILNADKLKDRYEGMNEVDGPVFKIENDPRFTRFGRFLSRTHLDELPQLWNVVKGDMFLVGFRPPTLDEVRQYKKWQMKRFEGYPGITSTWAVNGGHSKFSFDEWIKSDIAYEERRRIYEDFKLIFKTVQSFIKYFI